MEKYNPKKIESKWQKIWEKSDLYEAQDFLKKPKKYILVEFPYPSGAGLHVGHVRSYTALDVYSRKLRMEDFNVLYPIGWDAFGLPTENYAIKHKIHPRVATEKNIAVFKKQLKSLGISYDWSREINTTDPDYYKWTQWIFLKLLEKGLAYKKKMAINWCPKCKIGLANEEVINDKCERCGAKVEKREKEQWMLAITKYADRLLEDLDGVNYLEKIKTQQKNWIGKSEGVEFAMDVKDSQEKIEVYTTRIDTVFGMTYVVVAPEHPLIEKMKNKIENYSEVEKYIIQAQNKTDLERTELQKEKTGVELKGIKAINPFTNEEIPVFAGDYVLGFYGTGAVMAVPAHDERDFEFAKKYNLPIKNVIGPCFLDTTESERIREGETVEEREAIMALVKHNKKNEFITLKWKQVNWQTLITGGVEKGQTPEEAARMEILEETGYKNLKLIKEMPVIHSKFYHSPKKINRFAHFHTFYFELENEERDEISKEEQNRHELVWVSENKMADSISHEANKYVWKMFKEGGVAYIDDGVLSNSGDYSGLDSEQARDEMAKWLEEKGIGRKKVNYKLRDWVFSRQHYWGEPIPVILCPKCGIVPVSEKDLPVKLPEVKNYEPTETGESPLANIKDWVNVKCPKCGGSAKRETDTMPNWAGSSWYFLRYIDPKNNKELADKEKLKYWMPVDFYNGGMEHTTLHLLYSRFWNKFLFDIGISPVSEPYARRHSHGMVLAEDGRKMSKSFGNVVNPDDYVKEFGADTLRMYELFMGPFEEAIPWSTNSVIGQRRFLDKVWRLFERINTKEKQINTNHELAILVNRTIKKVTEDIENLRFNTAISAMMVLANEMEKQEKIPVTCYLLLVTLLSPFAPHICEELWEKLGHKESIFKEAWPKYDEKLILEEEIEMIVQINGKLRDKMKVSADISEEEATRKALESEKVKNIILGKDVKKVIFVKGRLINIVIKNE